MTAGEDSNSYFWDLKDTGQPFNSENTCFMPLRVVNSVMLPGAITSSDNCYRLVNHGVQRRMISVVNFFVFLRLLFFALFLLYVT